MRNFLKLLLLFTAFAVTSVAHPAKSLVTIPFVGCPADGQQGPEPATHGEPKHLAIPPTAAAQLAWYEFNDDGGEIDILAPRGWNCFTTVGSNGITLYVAPESLNAIKVLEHKDWRGFTGPAIQLSAMSGGTSGRFEVAHIAARVFPRYRTFVKNVIAEGLEPASDFHFGPFPTDRLIYKSDHLVQFTTPSNTTGLGTQTWLLKGPGDITGFAWVGGPDTDLLQLSVRLPPNLAALAPVIIHQAEAGYR